MAFKGSLKRIKSEINRLQAGVRKEVVRTGNTAMRQAAMAALKSYMKNSPVWSGETVRNYKVAIGGVPAGFNAPVGGTVNFPGGPIPEDVRNEARRSANVAAALSDARGVLAATNNGKELTRTIRIKNTIPGNKAALIEAGAAPTPDRSRYPGGLTAKARQAALAASKGKLK